MPTSLVIGSPNAPTSVHDGGTRHVIAAALRHVHVVMVSQIYISRPEAHAEVRDIIEARGRGEQALRDSGPRTGRCCSPRCVSRRSGYMTGVRRTTEGRDVP
jgi:hypothetical protein